MTTVSSITSQTRGYVRDEMVHDSRLPMEECCSLSTFASLRDCIGRVQRERQVRDRYLLGALQAMADAATAAADRGSHQVAANVLDVLLLAIDSRAGLHITQEYAGYLRRHVCQVIAELDDVRLPLTRGAT